MCVSNFTCILLENVVYAAACVSVSSHFGCQKSLSAVCFSCVFGHNLLYWVIKNRYSKKPAYVTKKYISDHTYKLISISLWFYCSGFGCENSSKMIFFRPKMRILCHKANLLELLNPENVWPWHCPTTYAKAKKAIYHLKDQSVQHPPSEIWSWIFWPHSKMKVVYTLIRERLRPSKIFLLTWHPDSTHLLNIDDFDLRYFDGLL